MRRLQIAAGTTFVSAWIVGLVLANGGPDPSDSASKVAAYYDKHEVKSIVATLLIDGLAGLAILAIAYCLWRYLAGQERRLHRAILVAGIGAGLASLAQMVVGVLMSYRAAHGSSAGHVKTLFKVLNNGDTVKIALLAIVIAAASELARRSGAFPGWLAIAGLVSAPLLLISGLAFPLNSDALYASLAVTLIALLLWVIAVTVVIARRTSPAAAAPRPAVP
jgi:Domain of unknown function (DUF4386)